MEAARREHIRCHGGKAGGGQRRRAQRADLCALLLLLRGAGGSALKGLTQAREGGPPSCACRAASLLRPVLIAALPLLQRAHGAAPAAERSKARHFFRGLV